MTLPAAGYLEPFAEGIAQLIAAEDIAEWDSTGNYTADQVGTVIAVMPTEPDGIVSLTPYPISDTLFTDDSVIALRVHLRGSADPRPVLQRNDQIFDLLQGLRGVEVGGAYVVVMWRQSSLLPVQDANQRWEISTVFYARVNWPSQHRPD